MHAGLSAFSGGGESSQPLYEHPLSGKSTLLNLKLAGLDNPTKESSLVSKTEKSVPCLERELTIFRRKEKILAVVFQELQSECLY